MTNKINIIDNEFDFGIDSRYKTKKERDQDSTTLLKARLERMKKMPIEQIIKAKLLQLKLKIENYINNLK